MSDSSLPSTEVEDVDLGDDAVQDLIQEAETLMHDLPLEPGNTNGDVNIDTSVVISGTDVASNDTSLGSNAAAEISDTKISAKPQSSAIDSTSADTRAAINIGGNFSIDDEEDEDIGDINDPLRAVEPPLASPSSGNKLDDHPLSATSFCALALALRVSISASLASRVPNRANMDFMASSSPDVMLLVACAS